MVSLVEAESALETPAIRPAASDRPERKGAIFGGRPARKDQRSAVSNGRRLHVIPPGDTVWSRRFRDILSEIVAEIVGDKGRDALSVDQLQDARRTAILCIECEKMEGIAAAGGEIDFEKYGRMTDRLGRCFARLRRLKREQKPVETVFDYIAEKYPKPAPPPAGEAEEASHAG